MRSQPIIPFVLLLCCAASQAQYNPQGGRSAAEENNKQAEHDRDFKNAMNAARPTSNAGEVMNQPIDADALAKKIAAGFKPPAKREVFEPTISPATERAWAEHDRLLERYKAGDADAGFTLGMSSYVGRPLSQSKVAAYEIWSSVADRNVKARYWAGRLLYAGEGTPADQTRGLAMMESAKAAGDVDAAAYLGSLSRTRSNIGEFPPMISERASVFAWRRLQFVPHDPKREKWVLDTMKRVEQHDKKASHWDYEWTGAHYLYGIGVPQDLSKARTYLTTALTMDRSDYNWTPKEHLMWLDLMEADHAAFIAQVNEVCAKGCNAKNLYLQAMADSLRHDAAQQRYHLIQAIEYGPQPGESPAPPEARVALAIMQLTGEGGPVDEASGLINLRSVAANPHAEYVLARLAGEGLHGVQKDPDAARSLMEAAAKAGQPDAVRMLASGSSAAAK